MSTKRRKMEQRRALWARNLYGPLPYRRGRFERLNDFERARQCQRCKYTGLVVIKWRWTSSPEGMLYPCNNCQMWAHEAKFIGHYWLYRQGMKWDLRTEIPKYAYSS